MEQDVFVKHECPCKLKFVFGGKNTCLPPCCQLKSFKVVALTVIYEEFWQNPTKDITPQKIGIKISW